MNHREKAKRYLKIIIATGFLCICSCLLEVYLLFSNELFQYFPFVVGLAGLFFLCLIICSFCIGRYKRCRAGIVGENQALRDLSQLPKSYHILTNVEIEYHDMKAEIDALVIAPNGLVIIEIKNHRGEIYGEEDDSAWIHKKVSAGGNTYENKIRNPIKQAKRQAYVLSNLLKEELSINCWIRTYVYLINGESHVESNQVFTDKKELIRKIQSERHLHLSPQKIKKIIKLLK